MYASRHRLPPGHGLQGSDDLWKVRLVRIAGGAKSWNFAMALAAEPAATRIVCLGSGQLATTAGGWSV